PEVHADRRITFRFRAPNAKEVTVRGEFGAKAHPLARAENGTWEVTIGPLEPDIYGYTFQVDGVSTIDPSNAAVKTGVRSSQSMVTVPGPEPMFYDEQDVPHGTLHRHFYKSKALGDRRDFLVYTPPGYQQDTRKKYPVLYLLHGAGDHSRSWVEVGRANFILDNLLADKSAEPMLIVMPFGHAYGGPDRVRQTLNENVKRFGEDLLGDIIPAVESRYRVLKNPQYRAIAGLSMGGGQALKIGMNHLDRFAWIGGFSSAVFPDDFDEQFSKATADAANTNSKTSLLWVAIGKDDFLIEPNQKFHEMLKAKGVEHTWKETEGAHSWRVWRRYLHELMPLLFQKTS
ncbi:MAG: esterase, partial [Bryobacteraceae bacterium]